MRRYSMNKKDMKALVAAMQSQATVKTIEVPTKNLVLTVDEVTFGQLIELQAASKDMTEVDQLVHMLVQMTRKLTLGDIVVDGEPFVGKDILDVVVKELTIKEIKMISDGLGEVIGLGKSD